MAPGSFVEGDLHTKECVIGGQVKGNIHASERVELQASAIIEGDIMTSASRSSRARVSGEVRMDGDLTTPR